MTLNVSLSIAQFERDMRPPPSSRAHRFGALARTKTAHVAELFAGVLRAGRPDIRADADLGRGVLGAANAAVIRTAQTAAFELAEHGINVNGIAPGVIDTDMWIKVDRQFGERHGRPIGAS